MIKSIGHRARLRENEHLFRYQAYFKGNLLRFVHAHAHVHALITRKSCAVGMRNAKLRNHPKKATTATAMRASLNKGLMSNITAAYVRYTS